MDLEKLRDGGWTSSDPSWEAIVDLVHRVIAVRRSLVAAEMPTGGSTVDEVEDGVEDELSYLSDRPSRPEETVYLQHKRSHLVTIL